MGCVVKAKREDDDRRAEASSPTPEGFMLTIETDWRLDVKSESQNVEFEAESSHFFSVCFFNLPNLLAPLLRLSRFCFRQTSGSLRAVASIQIIQTRQTDEILQSNCGVDNSIEKETWAQRNEAQKGLRSSFTDRTA